MPSIKEQIRRKMEKELDMDTEPDFKSTNGLEFLCARHWMRGFIYYKVGTCHGIYTADENNFQILAIVNDQPGNGHLQDV